MSKASAVDMQIEAIAEGNGIDVTEAAELYKNEAEFAVDLSNLPTVKHNWVRRGAKVSCEGAAHPHHSHFLRNQ